MAQLKTRGIMLDCARTMERKSFYTEILPFLRDWGYNLLHLHLADDQGCRLVFPRRPELAAPNAFTADEMRGLVKEAKRCHIEVVPEIESLGHTAFITRLPRYRKLGGAQDGVAFNALDPDHPQTRPLLKDLFADAAEIFDSPILHAGLDEVDFSRLPRFRKLPRHEHWPHFARHAAWVHDAIRSLGKRPAMWGDHILSARDMAKKFAPDLLVFDWHYRPEVDPESLDFLTAAGFEVWAAPATMWWYSRILTNPGNFRNLRELAAHAAQKQRPKVTGVVNTVWCPWRYLPGAMDWPIAWAGQVLSQPAESTSFCRQFCRDFYGLSAADSADAAAALEELYALAPDTPRLEAILQGGIKHTRERIRECRRDRPLIAACIRRLKKIAAKVRRHPERFHDVLLSGELIERWALHGASPQTPPGPKPALLKACQKRWNIERPHSPEIFPDAGNYQHILRLAARLT